MYYEEAVINGVLCWRGLPEEEFIQKTPKQLTDLLMEWRNMANQFMNPPNVK